MTSYWPLEESSGDVLNDISIYGKNHVVDSTLIKWEHDPSLKGKLLFSKHFLVEEGGSSGQEAQLLTSTAKCNPLCLYCTSEQYCKSCTKTTLLDSGSASTDCNCNSRDTPSISSADNTSTLRFIADPLEREFKPIEDASTQCEDPVCFVCVSGNQSECETCVTFGKFETGKCTEKCPDGMYPVTDSATLVTECASCTDTNCLSCDNEGKCVDCKAGYVLNKENQNCRQLKCGDGILDDGEECDDGNLRPGDGCNANCEIERYFECTLPNPYSQSICNPICGDGIFLGVGDEKCDNGELDANNNIVNPDGNGCSSSCKVEPGWWCMAPYVGGRSQCYCSPDAITSQSSFVDGSDYSVLLFEFTKAIAAEKEASVELCEKIFGDSVKYFGSGYWCEREEVGLKVHLGEDNEVYGGMVLSTLPGVITSMDACAVQFPHSVNFTVTPIPSPTVQANAFVPSKVAFCEPMRIIVEDVKGGLNRKFREISFTVTEINKTPLDDGDDIPGNAQMVSWQLSRFAKHDQETFIIDLPENSLIDKARYTVRLNVVNFQGDKLEEEKIYQFDVYSDTMLTVELEGATEDSTTEIHKHETITIKAIPRLHTCGTPKHSVEDVEVAYFKDGGEEREGRILWVRGSELGIGSEYRYTMRAKIGGSSLEVVKHFSIKVIHSPIILLVTPQIQILGSSQDFAISAEATYDRTFPSNSLAEKQDLTFAWECPPSLGIYKSAQVTLAANTANWLALGFPRETSCELTVKNVDGSRSNTTVVHVQIAATEGLSVALEGPEEIVQPHEIIFIYALINEMKNHKVVWEITGCDEVFKEFLGTCAEMVGVIENNKQCFKCELGKTEEHYLRLDLSAWDLSGKDFSVTMKVVSGNTQLAERKRKVAVDSVPAVGRLSVAPLDGKAWNTAFTMTVENVKDADHYGFFYKQKEVYTPLTIKGRANSVTMQLPVGSMTDDYNLELLARAYNKRGGYSEAKAVVKCSAQSEAVNASALYEELKAGIDKQNPSAVIAHALLGSLMLKPKDDAALNENPNLACSGHGTLISSKCYCDPFYGTRADCSIHDLEIADNQQLALEILKDVKENALLECSLEMDKAVARAVVNVATKSDILTEETRSLARDLLYATIGKTGEINADELAKAIDSVAALSSKGEEVEEGEHKINAELEFNKVYQMIDILLTREIESDPKAKQKSYSLQNINTETRIYSSNIDEALDNGVLEIESISELMATSKGHMKLTMVEWKTPIYTWTSQYSEVKTNVISVYVKDAQGKEMAVAGLKQPVSIKFPLDVEKNSALELTNLRCMSHNKTMFSVEEMRVENLDMKKKIGICMTHHLTDFAMVIPREGSIVFSHKKPTEQILIPEEVKVYKVHRSPLFWFTVALTLVFVYFLLWAYCKEKSEYELGSFVHNKAYDNQKQFFQDRTKVGSLSSFPDAVPVTDPVINPEDDQRSERAEGSGGESDQAKAELRLKEENEGSFRDSSVERENVVRATEMAIVEDKTREEMGRRRRKKGKKKKRKKELVKVEDPLALDPQVQRQSSLADSEKAQTDTNSGTPTNKEQSLAMALGRMKGSSGFLNSCFALLFVVFSITVSLQMSILASSCTLLCLSRAPNVFCSFTPKPPSLSSLAHSFTSRLVFFYLRLTRISPLDCGSAWRSLHVYVGIS